MSFLKKAFKSAQVALFVAVQLFVSACSGEPRKLNGMTIEKSGDEFKILQLTDIQIIDPSQQPYEGRLTPPTDKQWADRDINAFNLVRRLVKDTDPDWIILTGDNVYG